MTPDELRAKFKNWWLCNGDPFNLHKVAAWETWQAAHASRDAEVEALQDALFQISVRLKAEREPDMDDMSWHTDMMARAQYLSNVEAEVEALRKDAERWRHARKLLTIEDIEEAQRDFVSYGRMVSEEGCAYADQAIDAAMREEK